MQFRKIKLLYKKELMDVLRDKKTIFTMVVLPVILYPLIFLLGMQIMTMIASSQQEHTYQIAYAQVKSQYQDTLNQWFQSKENKLDYHFKEKKTDDPAQALKDEKIDAYITTQITKSQVTYQIHYLSAVDNSSEAADMLKEEIQGLSQQTAKEQLQSLGMDVQKILEPVTARLTDQSSQESSMGKILGSIVPLLLIIGILMGCMYPAIDTTAGEKERGTLETILTLPVSSRELIMSKFLSVATMAIVSVFMNILSIGVIMVYLYQTIQGLSAQKEAFHMASFVPAILIAVVCVAVFALFMSAISMCICVFAKSFKEANNYITPLTLVVMLAAYVGFIPSISLDYQTALIPVVNICLLMKDLLVFKYSFAYILVVLLSNMVYAFAAIWFLGKIYDSESVLFSESMSGIRLFERRKNIRKGSMPSVQEGLLVFIVMLLIIVYVGGIASMKNVWLGVIVPQCTLLLLPIGASLYIKGDLKRIFRLHLPGVKQLLGGLCLYVGMGSLTMLLSNGLSYLFSTQSQDLSDAYAKLLNGLPFLGALLLIALLPAVCEEIFFRGYLLSAFEQKMRVPYAVVCVSLLFGISHMSLIKLLPTAVLGLALAYAAYQSDSLGVSSLIHFLNNAFAVFVMYYGDKVPALNGTAYSIQLLAGMIVCAILFLPCGGWLLYSGKRKKEAVK